MGCWPGFASATAAQDAGDGDNKQAKPPIATKISFGLTLKSLSVSRLFDKQRNGLELSILPCAPIRRIHCGGRLIDCWFTIFGAIPPSYYLRFARALGRW